METEKEITDMNDVWSDMLSTTSLTNSLPGMAEIIKSIQEISSISDGKRHPLHPKQKAFLTLLKENKDEVYDLSDQDNICIIHCLKYNHYSDIHRDTLNKLIKKYAR